ncbi:MAG: hypothetical protein JXA18_13700, partial [Chitinispirillaceae bacterium]|nr:hypothetical protein [Chitinispirillaceae bacterium]
EIGVWQSTDDASQFVYSYSYCGGNPVGFVDPDGNCIPTFSINKNGLSIGFNCGWWELGGRMSWNGEFAMGPYAELGPRFGPEGIFGLTLQSGTMLSESGKMYQTGSVGFDVDRIIGAGASTTYSYNRNEFGDIDISINYMTASMSYNTNTGNINYSLSLDNYLVENSNYKIAATFSWGDDGFDIGVSGTYQQREIGIDKEFYDWLKGKLKDTKTDKNAPWGKTIEVGQSLAEVAPKIPYYVPNTFWGLFASLIGLHEGWQMRLPGGYHLTTVSKTGAIEAHKDYFDPSSGPVQTFLHIWYEVRKK